MLSKKVTHNRLRPKPSSKNTARSIKPDTFKSPEYLHWLHNDRQPSCALCCRSYFSGMEIHHIRDKSVLGRDDSKVIMLCGVDCHRLGVFSAHGNTKEFNEMLPKEWQFGIAYELFEEWKSINID